MKKLLCLIFGLLALSSVALRAQIISLDITTLSTNTTRTVYYFTATNIVNGVTNVNQYAVLTRSNFVTAGEALAVSMAKITNNFKWLSTSVRTNGGTNGQIPVISPGTAYGYYWTNVSAFGNGTDTNKVPIYNGGATNLTVTNRFTLTSTTPYYTVATVTFTNGTWGDTNKDGTYYPSDGTYGPGSLTNINGEVIFASNITSNLQSRVSSIWVTNEGGGGFYYPISKAYAIFTNTAPPNNFGTITISNVPPDYSGDYISSGQPIWAPGFVGSTNLPAFTNVNGLTSCYYSATNSNSSYWVAVYNNGWDGATFPHNYTGNAYWASSITASNPPAGWVTNGSACCGGYGGGSNAVFTFNITTNSSPAGQSIRWATYATNAWRFYSSSNATFLPDSETIVSTNYTESFYVTNVTISPNPSLTYLGNNGTPVIFNATNDFALTFTDPSYFFFGSIPGAGEIAFVSAGTNNTSPLTDWVNESGGSSTGGFYSRVGSGQCGSLPLGFSAIKVLGDGRTYEFYCDGNQKIKAIVH